MNINAPKIKKIMKEYNKLTIKFVNIYNEQIPTKINLLKLTQA